MSLRRTRSAPTLFLWLGAACAAAAAPLPRALTIEPGRRTRVLLTEVKSGRTLVLQNASSGKPSEDYSDRDGDQFVKVAGDADLQQLLDVLAQQGMFEHPAAVPGDARDLLVVDTGERRWVWPRRLFGLQEAEMPFHEARAYFLTVYNQALALRSGDLQKADLQAERARVRSDSDAAQKHLQGLQGPPK